MSFLGMNFLATAMPLIDQICGASDWLIQNPHYAIPSKSPINKKARGVLNFTGKIGGGGRI
jgi:hypothetical protein